MGLICTISLFAYSHNMTDAFIVPKWCFTIGMLLLSAVALISFNKAFLINVSICSYIIIASCLFQALYALADLSRYIKCWNCIRKQTIYTNYIQ